MRPRSARSKTVALAPTQAGNGIAGRVVFAADPAGVAELVDPAEQILPADLAGARLVPVGHVADLDVLDLWHQLAEPRREIALRDLAVIRVELQADAVAADRLDDRRALLLPRQEIAGRIARV